MNPESNIEDVSRDSDPSEAARGLHINAEDIHKLPLFRYEGPIELIDRDKLVPAAIAQLEKEELLGFDTETQPSFEKGQSFPTSLIQLATAKKVFLFQLGLLKGHDWFPRIFSSRQIIKVGVAIDQDIAKLCELYAFVPTSFVDLARMAAELGIKNRGLRGLAALLMGIRVPKGARRSNWGRISLTKHQLAYAAADAWLCRELYIRLLERVPRTTR